MTIIGSLIKGVIDVSQNIGATEDHRANQHKELVNLLKTARNTAFGKYYGFEHILESQNMEKAFREGVPYFNYEQMCASWWKQIHKGLPDITWPGRPAYYALSSGTTGTTSKRIPVTGDMINAIRQTGLKQISALSNFDLPGEFFEKEIMMLGSSTNLQDRDDELKEGEISGISARNIPFWFRGYYKPGAEIARIDDWNERVKHIAMNARKWDIGALSGIPSWVELMLQEVISYHQVKNIHEVWPNLSVYTSGGVAFKPYEKSFNALLGRPVTLIDTYLASEGFLAFQKRPETTSMQLVTDNGIYFEFVPFKPEHVRPDGSLDPDAPVRALAEVEPDTDYILLISTVSGTWRYLIGDTIAFTDVTRAEIKITGRTKFFMNVVGSQLSVNKMNDAIRYLEEKFDIHLPEFTLSAIKIDGEFYHKWYIGHTDNITVSDDTLAHELDERLKDANKNYRVARSKALKGVRVNTIPLSVFYDWSAARKKKGGQVKMEKVMEEEKFKEFEKFVREKLS